MRLQKTSQFTEGLKKVYFDNGTPTIVGELPQGVTSAFEIPGGGTYYYSGVEGAFVVNYLLSLYLWAIEGSEGINEGLTLRFNLNGEIIDRIQPLTDIVGDITHVSLLKVGNDVIILEADNTNYESRFVRLDAEKNVIWESSSLTDTNTTSAAEWPLETSLSPDGTKFSGGGDIQSVYIYNVSDGTLINSWKVNSTPRDTVWLNNTDVASINDDFNVYISPYDTQVDASGFAVDETFVGQPGGNPWGITEIYALASNGTNRLYLGGENGSTYEYDTTTSPVQELRTLSSFGSPIKSLALDGDDYLYIGTEDNFIRKIQLSDLSTVWETEVWVGINDAPSTYGVRSIDVQNDYIYYSLSSINAGVGRLEPAAGDVDTTFIINKDSIGNDSNFFAIIET